MLEITWLIYMYRSDHKVMNLNLIFFWQLFVSLLVIMLHETGWFANKTRMSLLSGVILSDSEGSSNVSRFFARVYPKVFTPEQDDVKEWKG